MVVKICLVKEHKLQLFKNKEFGYKNNEVHRK